MDRFVSRAPTWKTLEMSSFSRSFANVSLTGKKSTPKQDKLKIQTNRRLSIRDENLLKIFTDQADEPLMLPPTQELSPLLAVRFNGSFGGGAVAVSCENYSQHSRRLVSSDENTPPPNAQITSNNEPAADVMCSSGESNSRPSTPITNMIPAKFASCTPKANPFLAQIQRDLNSPSAATRVRAIKALRSPTKCAYANFDVPHEEQDIITEEERKSPVKAKSIQELMKDVVVYVEVRTGEDNRSSGVKKVISALGAKVNDKLLRDTTHVVFKDGLLSTYNKAKKWNIPIVSILWIEACKKQMRLMSPKDFPISNSDRYENPELYDKMKRYKSMQPDAEANRRVHKAKVTTTENAAKIKTKPIPATSSNIHRTKKKTEITRFFTKAENLKNPTASRSITTDSPSTQISKKINDSACSPKTPGDSLRQLAYLDSVSSLTDTIELTPKPGASKTILGLEEIKTEIASSTASTQGTPSRRRNSTQVTQTPQKVNQNVPNTESSISATPGVRTRRRSSIHIPTNMSITEQKGDKSSKPPFSTISEEVAENPIQEDEKCQTTFTERSIDITKNTPLQKSNGTRRRTLYTPKPMEESKLLSPTHRTSASVNKRRTVFATTSKSYDGQSMEMSSFAPITPFTGGIPSSTLIGEESVKTPLQFASLLEEHASATIFNSTKTPANSRRRTLFDVSMDIITQRLQNINQSAKSVRVAQTNERRNSQDDPDTIAALLTPTDNRAIRRELFIGNKDSTIKQLPIAAASPSQSDTATTTTTPIETVTKKKRKLFVPNEILLTPTPQLSPTEPENQSAVPKRIRNSDTPIKTPVNTKRRRTIMPTLTQSKTEQKKPPPKNNGAVARSSRRSTMDFEAIKKAKSVIKKSTDAATQGDAATNKTKPYPFLVYTNMHTEQIEFIKEAISTLSGFQLEDNVSENTTHIVSLEPRRTVNLLRGLIRGLWIVNYNWVVDSVATGQWLNEEQYELRDFSRAVEICRSERQAFGKGYKMYLFSDLGPMYISSKSSIPKECLKELIVLCAGRVTDQRKRAKYIIGESSPNLLPNKIYLNPQWILDSISNNQIQKLTKYFVTTTTEEKQI